MSESRGKTKMRCGYSERRFVGVRHEGEMGQIREERGKSVWIDGVWLGRGRVLEVSNDEVL